MCVALGYSRERINIVPVRLSQIQLATRITRGPVAQLVRAVDS
jgi:hypothetical protein